MVFQRASPFINWGRNPIPLCAVPASSTTSAQSRFYTRTQTGANQPNGSSPSLLKLAKLKGFGDANWATFEKKMPKWKSQLAHYKESGISIDAKLELCGFDPLNETPDMANALVAYFRPDTQEEVIDQIVGGYGGEEWREPTSHPVRYHRDASVALEWCPGYPIPGPLPPQKQISGNRRATVLGVGNAFGTASKGRKPQFK